MLKLVSSNKCFGGYQKVFAHQSEALGCEMKFGIYLPPTHDDQSKHPVLYFLSGLTCTEANFIQKSAFQKYAAVYGLIVVNPDTSPRGVGIAGEDDSYDFGSGAGFYLDATETKWSKHYRMYSYVVDELPALIATNFSTANTASQGITGHSMGGHGALTIALKNAHKYKCVSAIAPICNPTMCPWGIKAFGGYLGVDNKDAWKRYDACELAKQYVDDRQFDILIDQGEEDEFLKTEQLLPEHFVAACSSRLNVQLRMQPGYDHSYFFISTFIADHIAHHSKYLH